MTNPGKVIVEVGKALGKKLRPCMPLPNWRRPSKVKWWLPHTRVSLWFLDPSTSFQSHLILA